MKFVQRLCERFAAESSTANVIGSVGAQTYQTTIGTAGFTVTSGSGYDTTTNTATYVTHTPTATAFDGLTPGGLQFTSTNSQATISVKTAYQGAVNQVYLYYTTDGVSYPQGAGGYPGNSATKVAAFTFIENGQPDGTQVTNWWQTTIATGSNGTVLRYKIGALNNNASSEFPDSLTNVAVGQAMETLFQITNFSPSSVPLYPNNDYGVQQTGLSQGFHILRSRAFLKRANPNRSAIYNTFTQTFYYDTQLPAGQIIYPAAGATLNGQEYGVVLRADDSVTDVQYNIQDGDPTNDDSATGASNGNNAWVEAAQMTYTPTLTSSYNNEWRFNYVNIPPSATGAATIQVRLRKLTSSTNNALSDSAGHFTTLTWSGPVNGPSYKMFVAYPGSDGYNITSGQQPYKMKVWFSPALASGVSNPTNTANSDTQAFLNNFTVTVSSSESGIAAYNLPESSFSIDATGVDGGQYDELAIPLPVNSGNANTDFLVTISYAATGGPTLTASRLYTEQPVPFILNTILTPPQYNSDGVTPYTIVLPAAGSATPLPIGPQSGSYSIQVLTDTNATAVALNFTQGGVTGSNVVANPTPVLTGSNSEIWSFAWKNIVPGAYSFTSSVSDYGIVSGTTQTNTVVFEPLVPANSSADEDNDGMVDADETTPYVLPANPVNEDVRRYLFSGNTNPLSPDTDDDGLPDGLEAGIATAPASTGTAATLNGYPTFIPDADPPIYNTPDNATAPAGYTYFNPWPYNANNPVTDQLAGSTTDPTKSDTDGDGLPDGIEDLHYLLITATAGQQIVTLTATGANSATWGATILSGSNPFTWSAPITTATAGQAVLTPTHNGRVEIGLLDSTGSNITSIIQHPPTIYNTSTVNISALPANAIFLETDPNNSDTDGDGIPDGDEDSNHNGMLDMAFIDRDQTDANGNYVVLGPVDDSNSLGFGRYHDFTWRFTDTTQSPPVTSVYNRVNKNLLNAAFPPGVWKINPANGHHIDVIWLETDPLEISTSGDSLPDGWKIAHGLDPWDDGVIGDYNLHTGKVITTNANGPNGLVPHTNVTNEQLYLNPTILTSGSSAPLAGSITIGPSNPTTVGGVTNNHEFTGWTANDLIGLDYYDGDGTNAPDNNDVYHFYDGYDSSRDLVAFYARDGGAAANGGDGNFYFRCDFQDLLTGAEEGNLDVYVVIHFGSAGAGEFNLPDNVKTGTAMGWQVVVACYQTNEGRVYLWNPNSATHSTAIGQDLTQFGVTSRDQTTANGFEQAYFNSDLDACDFSISRQALLDAGWDGVNAAELTYQVFTVHDGTKTGGAGNIAGRSDITDTFYDNWIASDAASAQAGIDGTNSVLQQSMGINARNDRGKKIKVVSLIDDNEAIQPGSYIQHLINTGSSSGFYRPLDVHQAYNLPLTMHITPTLASAIQWASVSATSAAQYVDGPSFNQRIAGMAASGSGAQIDLLGSTFSDHIVKYFGSQFNADNTALASYFLTSIYGRAPSSNILWDPERVANDTVLSQISGLGYRYTVLDQMRHIYEWFGFESALDDDANRINSINGENVFVINDLYSGLLFQNTDNGLPLLLRQVFNQRLLNDSNEDQVFIFENSWQSFTTKANADAYDLNMRWIASHPWIEMVTLDQIVSGTVGYLSKSGSTVTTWGTVNRGSGLTLPMSARDLVDHATAQNYDNWYYGSTLAQSLSTDQFSIRSATNAALVPTAYGLNTGSGIIATAWSDVASLSGANPLLTNLARATIHASVFETAYHTETNNNLDTFSDDSYAYPVTDNQSLATLSTWAQSQSREAAVYNRVDTWANSAASGAYNLSAGTQSADIDLDGEPEYMIYNDRLFALFEALGGRMTGAWIRDINTGAVIQVAGNFASYAGSATEEEGNANMTTTGSGAYRTSGFKDWFAQTGGAGVGTSNYVNNYYTVTSATSGIGWTFKSSDGSITKTITLAPRATHLDAAYKLSGGVNRLYVRLGMSPNLSDLFINGQQNMSTLTDGTNDEFSVIDNNSLNNVRAFLKWGGTNQVGVSYNALYDPGAVDVNPVSSFNTVNMRNQAQTQEIELQGTNGMTFSVGFQTGSTVSISTMNDGIPDWWKLQYGLNPATEAGNNGPNADPAGDGLTNYQKWVLGLDPTKMDYYQVPVQISRDSQGRIVLQFPTLLDRVYTVFYTTSLTGTWTQLGGTVTGTGATGTVLDDGSQTGSPPSGAQQRFYKVGIQRILN